MNNQRSADLAAIHIDATALGLIKPHDDSAYRDMLFTIARVRSARDLDDTGRKQVRDHLRKLRGPVKSKRRYHHPGAPHNIDSKDRGPRLRKIEALLADAKLPWSYADSMAAKMFHVERLSMCSPKQLHAIISALEYNAKRRSGFRGHGTRTQS